ncbi:hypothetical protein DL768_001776 [Monosporascus sp. mg162]|nr:hypothetical protein DL768_001776 [Monosporascus sp. mg162]
MRRHAASTSDLRKPNPQGLREFCLLTFFQVRDATDQIARLGSARLVSNTWSISATHQGWTTPITAVRRVPAPVDRARAQFLLVALAECEDSRGNAGRSDVATTGNDSDGDNGAHDNFGGLVGRRQQETLARAVPNSSERHARDAGPEASYAEPP